MPSNSDIPSEFFHKHVNWREGIDFEVETYQEKDLLRQQGALRFDVEFPEDGDTEELVRRRIAEFEELALWGDSSFIDVGSMNETRRLHRVKNWYEYTKQSEFK